MNPSCWQIYSPPAGEELFPELQRVLHPHHAAVHEAGLRQDAHRLQWVLTPSVCFLLCVLVWLNSLRITYSSIKPDLGACLRLLWGKPSTLLILLYLTVRVFFLHHISMMLFMFLQWKKNMLKEEFSQQKTLSMRYCTKVELRNPG